MPSGEAYNGDTSTTVRRQLLLFPILLVACNSVLGLDERPPRKGVTSGAGGGSSDGGGGTGGRHTPACESVCEGDVPEGWTGPTAVQTGASEPTCDGPLGNVELTLFDDPIAPTPECECACGAAVGIDCNASPITVSSYPNNNCGGSPEYADTGVVGQCLSLCCGGQFSAHYTAPVPDVSSATCPPMTITATVPPHAWGLHLVGCGPVGTYACEGGTCFDTPEAADLCIYRSGEHSCPAGPFSEGTIRYGGFDDTRACETCGCGTVDAVCNEVVIAHHNNSCSAQSGTLVDNTSCAQPSPDLDSARFESVSPTGSCTPTGGAPTGAFTPTQATTVCCLRPDT